MQPNKSWKYRSIGTLSYKDTNPDSQAFPIQQCEMSWAVFHFKMTYMMKLQAILLPIVFLQNLPLNKNF